MQAKVRLLLLAAAVAVAFALVGGNVPRSPEALRSAAGPVDGAAVLAAAVVAWIVLTPALVSATLLAVTCGLVLGTAVGVPVSILGATLGGIVAFALGRVIGQGAVERLAGPRLTRFQERLARRGFLAVLAARLAPAPATFLHYAAGLSRVRLRDFAPAIALGGAPRHFAYTALGGSGGDVSSPPALIALGVLAALTLGGGLAAWRRRRRARERVAAAPA